MFPEVIKGFILLAFIFLPLERLFTLHPQKIFRPQWGTDATYFFIGNLIGKAGIAISAFITFSLLGNFINPELQNRVASQPEWLQLIAAVIIADIGYYIAHRLLHTVPWMWKFHAVHHSIQHLDWLATVRVHPLDQIFTKTCQMIPLYLLGFNAKSLAIYALFSAGIAFFIHSNIRLKLALLKWLIATPEFHHWHHVNEPKIHNQNFAAQIPLLDWLFGTLYTSEKRTPNRYGISEQLPSNYFRQLLYPFKGK
jgi:sterol desaturase/sphingolipid hydroxylase (fatty acid hydroxylase superfamily)